MTQVSSIDNIIERPAESNRLPAVIRNFVLERDQNQCQFPIIINGEYFGRISDLKSLSELREVMNASPHLKTLLNPLVKDPNFKMEWLCGNDVTVHHISPKHLSGNHSPLNLITLSKRLHNSLHRIGELEFKEAKKRELAYSDRTIRNEALIEARKNGEITWFNTFDTYLNDIALIRTCHIGFSNNFALQLTRRNSHYFDMNMIYLIYGMKIKESNFAKEFLKSLCLDIEA